METKMISASQKKIIWALWKKELGLGDSLLYARLLETYGVERMSALTYLQADSVIRGLRRVQYGLGPDRLTPDQYRALSAYQASLGWDGAHLRNYIRRQVGVDEPKWLSIRQARSVLAGLENIKRHKERKENGLQR